MYISSRRLALVQLRHLAERGLLSFLRLLRAFFQLNAIKRGISRAAPLVYNTQSGLSPREVPFRSIDLGEVALRPYPT